MRLLLVLICLGIAVKSQTLPGVYVCDKYLCCSHAYITVTYKSDGSTQLNCAKGEILAVDVNGVEFGPLPSLAGSPVLNKFSFTNASDNVIREVAKVTCQM